MSSALRASPWARTIIDYWKLISTESTVKDVATRLFFLYRLVDQERGSECSLLCNLGKKVIRGKRSGDLSEETDLFGLDGMCEFRGERNMCNGDVVQHNIEP